VPKFGSRDLDVRVRWEFITLQPNQVIEHRHEIPREKIAAAELEKGEVYKAELTDLGLGTSWWMYGTMDDVGDKKFMRWSPRGVEGLRRYQTENEDWLGEPPDDVKWENSSEWFMGEDPSLLALVVEKNAAEFEIV
jgi:hypothetical protein